MEQRKITIKYVPERRRTFTDRMYRANLIFAIAVTLYILGLMTLSAFTEQIDLSPSAYIVAPIWVEVGAFSLANIRKHERENKNGNKSGAIRISGENNSSGESGYGENENTCEPDDCAGNT